MWVIESESINISSFEDYIRYNIIQKGDGENCLSFSIQVTINTCKLEGIFTNKNKKTEFQ